MRRCSSHYWSILGSHGTEIRPDFFLFPGMLGIYGGACCRCFCRRCIMEKSWECSSLLDIMPFVSYADIAVSAQDLQSTNECIKCSRNSPDHHGTVHRSFHSHS